MPHPPSPDICRRHRLCQCPFPGIVARKPRSADNFSPSGRAHRSAGSVAGCQSAGRRTATRRSDDRIGIPATPACAERGDRDLRRPPARHASCWWAPPVTLLAILAVRVSSRAGLPSLLIYLLMGVALGESGLGHPVRRRRAGPCARVRGAGADPRRGWSDHQLARRPPLDAAGRLAGDDRRRGVGGDDRASARTTCSGCRGSWRSCSARSPRRPTPRRCSRCCASCRCRGG